MKKVLIVIGVAAALVGTALLIKKFTAKPAGASIPERKKTIITEIMAMPKGNIDIEFSEAKLGKLTEGELASFKIMIADVATNGEAKMSAANKKVMAELMPKYLKG